MGAPTVSVTTVWTLGPWKFVGVSLMRHWTCGSRCTAAAAVECDRSGFWTLKAFNIGNGPLHSGNHVARRTVVECLQQSDELLDAYVKEMST